MMRTDIKVDLYLFGESLGFDQISRELQVEPTRVWRQGDRIAQTSLRRKEDCWVRNSGLPPSEDQPTHILALLDLFYPKRSELNALRAKMGFEVQFSSCVESYDGDRPALGFHAETVRKLAELNASIDIDLYVLDDDDDDGEDNENGTVE